jgi:Carboxypeptidase regulatory-like domain/TonB dependent receptor
MLTRFHRLALQAMMLAILAITGVAAWSQTVTGSIRGTIVDKSGAVVADTTITARNVGTGVVVTTKTDRSGTYSIQILPIGTYIVSATKPGFSVTSNRPFTLEIDQIAKIDMQLQVGEVTSTVDVAADSGSVLQTEDSALGTTITTNTLGSMPLSGQNFSSATLFVPGAVDPTYSAMGGSNGTERDTTASSLPSFNGNRQQTNNYILDGADINETINNVVGYNPAPEALQEIRVITGNASAEYGNVNGGEVLMVTKGGTNRFHGSLYSFYENQDLTANLWSNNYNHLPKGVFHQNQFGATFGGPVYKNKLFFFVDYEGYRNTASGTGTASVPTARMRTGDFSEFLGVNSTVTTPIQLFNTQNGLAPKTKYVNNQIPIVNPVAKYLFAHPEIYPLPNHQGTSTSTSPDSSNYVSSTESVNVNNQGDSRIDYTLGPHDSINVRFSMGDAWDATPKTVLPITFPGSDEYPFIGGVINEVHTFTSALQNEFRAGYSRIGWLQGTPIDSTGQFGTSGNAKLGIPFANQPYAGFSQINLSSVESNVGTRGAATTYYDNIFDYGDDVIWLRGKHIIKLGAQSLRYQQNNFYPSTNGVLGLFSYNGSYTANTTAGATVPAGTKLSGYGFADFVLDDSSSQAVGGVAGRVGQRQYRLAFYAEDDWKLRPNLTLNLGLRYGYDQPIYEVNNKEVNVNSDNPGSCPNCLEFAGQNGNSRALYNPFYKEFMPRLGFAYQMNPGVVIRGGYGITDDLEGTGANLRMSQNAPFIFQFANTSLSPTATSGGTPAPVENGFAQAPGNVAVASTQYKAWAHNLRPALIQQFNLATQVLLNSNTTAQIGYVGEVGQHLIVPEQANEYTTPGVPASGPYYKLVGAGGIVYLTQSEGYSNYHGLQVTVRQRASHGLEYTFNYTFSKSMTNNPGFYGVSGVDNSSVFQQNIYNPHGDYGVAGTDSRNAVNFIEVYALPFGHGRDFGSNWNRLIDGAIGGWKISGDAILYSGFPITISSTNVANSNASAARANQYMPLIVKNRSLTNWFGTDPSAKPCSGAFNGTCAYGPELTNTFGTAHVNSERAPGYRIIDMSVFKEFRTYREQVILFRADAFNAFNMASYSAPSNSANSSTFGLITSTLSPARQFQFSAKYRF